MQHTFVWFALDFGLVNEGPGMEQTVKITNAGHDTLNISTLYMHGMDTGQNDGGVQSSGSSAYRIVSEDLSGTQLEAQASTVVQVRMDPNYDLVVAAGGIGSALSDALIIESDALNTPQLEVPMTGQVNLAPQAVAVEMLSRMGWVKIDLGREVEIDGSDTWEPEGDPFTFAWSLAAKPEESHVELPESTLATS